jgi:hypothetical protein
VAEKDAPKEPNKEKAAGFTNDKPEANTEVPVNALLSDLVAFVDEINARYVSDTTANQEHRKRELYWQKGYVIAAATLAALTLWVLYLTYRASNRLATTADAQARIMTAQAAILDKQREIATNTVTAIKAQLDEQVAANRPAIVANGVFPTKSGPVPQSWIRVEDTKGIPPRNVAVGWRNFGKSIATDFVQKGHLILAKPGDPAPKDPGCDESHQPEKQTNRSALAPDNTMSVVWDVMPGTDLTEADNGAILYAVGCAYYNGLDKGHYFSDVCLLWVPEQQPEFQPCQDTNRNYIH